jgi:hypothetical protein
MAATDAVNSHKEWSGTKCDDSNLDVNGFNFDSSGNGMSTIAGQMNTTTKANKFVAFYKDKTSTEHHLAAVCAQDR